MLHKGMNIICRTEEERVAFLRACEKQNIKWAWSNASLEASVHNRLPNSYQIGWDSKIPMGLTQSNDLTYAEREKNFRTYEASELFRNQIIQINLEKTVDKQTDTN